VYFGEAFDVFLVRGCTQGRVRPAAIFESVVYRMKHISLEPWHSHPLSYANTSLRLFEYNGALLRGIGAAYESKVRELFDKRVLETIIAQDLFVPTEISDYSCDEYPLVLKHEKIQTITYPTEWCPEALRAAGMTVLDLQEILLSQEYMLIDINPWNILFRRTRPVFVDLGSIIPCSSASSEQFLDEFNRYYFWPLRLAKKGLWRYVIYFFGDYNKGVRYGDALLLLGSRELGQSMTLFSAAKTLLGSGIRRLPEPAKRHLRRLRSVTSPLAPSLAANDLRTKIDQLRRSLSEVALPKGDDWKHGRSTERFDDWNQKQHNVKHIFGKVAPKSLFDVCANSGRYSLLAESMGIRAMSSDVVPDVMSQLYLNARDGDRDIYPIVMDFCDPSPARGVANNWFKAATQRFRSDMVMCLAAIHKLVFGSQLSFDQIVAGLGAFSEKWLLVEFIPRDDETAGKYGAQQLYDWYTESNFVRALEHRFQLRETFPSFPEPRKLLLCERKQIE